MRRRGLFVTQYVPFRRNTGARIYSAQLIEQFAAACDALDVVCATEEEGYSSAGMPRKVTLHTFSPRGIGLLQRAAALAPASTLHFDTADARAAFGTALAKAPDFFVIDHIAASWALRHIPTGLNGVYCAHNDEYDTRMSIARAAGFPSSVLHRADALRIYARERKISRRVGLLTAINRRDLDTQTRRHGFGNSLYLPPFRSRHSPEPCDPATHPRNIVLLGSLEWAAKKQNLAEFLSANAAPLAAKGIGIVVAGRAENRFLAKMRARYPGVRFLGTVESERDALEQGRIGVLYGRAGGGFRLTSLSYTLHGLPVASPRDFVGDLGLMEDSYIRTDTAEGFAEAIAAVTDDAGHLRRVGENGRRAALAFCAEAEALPLGEAIEALIRDRGVPHG